MSAPIPIVARADADVPSPNKTIDLSAYAGTYTNPGYGNITFCAPNDAGTSAYCNNTFADFASFGPLDANNLYARSPRIVSHFSVERVCTTDSNNGTAGFVIHPLSIYPHG